MLILAWLEERRVWSGWAMTLLPTEVHWTFVRTFFHLEAWRLSVLKKVIKRIDDSRGRK